MNHSEQVTELRKQIRTIDALLAKCTTPDLATNVHLEELYVQAQAFLKHCILLQEYVKKPKPAAELPDFDQLDLSNKTDSNQIPDAATPIETKNPASAASQAPASQVPQELKLEESVKKIDLTPKKTESNKEQAAKTSNTQRLADKIHRVQVKDLRKALPLHEKFRFINELFDGNSVAFDSALQKLESSASSANALSILSEMQGQLSWEADHPLLEKLIELIEKRFS